MSRRFNRGGGYATYEDLEERIIELEEKNSELEEDLKKAGVKAKEDAEKLKNSSEELKQLYNRYGDLERELKKIKEAPASTPVSASPTTPASVSKKGANAPATDDLDAVILTSKKMGAEYDDLLDESEALIDKWDSFKKKASKRIRAKGISSI